VLLQFTTWGTTTTKSTTSDHTEEKMLLSKGK